MKRLGRPSPTSIVFLRSVSCDATTFCNGGSAAPADFLMNVIAGDSEEVDQSIEMAKGAAMEGLLRSGAASSVLSKVPGAGAVLGMFGGFGGKKKRPSPPSTRAKKATTVAATKRQKLEVVAAAPVPAFHFHEPALTTINETTDQLFGSLLVKKNGDDDSDYLTIGLSDLESQCGSQGV